MLSEDLTVVLSYPITLLTEEEVQAVCNKEQETFIWAKELPPRDIDSGSTLNCSLEGL